MRCVGDDALHSHQEPEQPLYCAAAADSFAEEVVWFSGIMGRLPQYCRARALRPLTLLYLHLESVPHTERFRQSTARDFLANQLLPLLQCTGAADVALEVASVSGRVAGGAPTGAVRGGPRRLGLAQWLWAVGLLIAGVRGLSRRCFVEGGQLTRCAHAARAIRQFCRSDLPPRAGQLRGCAHLGQRSATTGPGPFQSG